MFLLRSLAAASLAAIVQSIPFNSGADGSFFFEPSDLALIDTTGSTADFGTTDFFSESSFPVVDENINLFAQNFEPIDLGSSFPLTDENQDLIAFSQDLQPISSDSVVWPGSQDGFSALGSNFDLLLAGAQYTCPKGGSLFCCPDQNDVNCIPSKSLL